LETSDAPYTAFKLNPIGVTHTSPMALPPVPDKPGGPHGFTYRGASAASASCVVKQNQNVY
jgi:hypothetical protein